MAKNTAKKKVLKNAQKAANSSTLNAVARNKQKGSAKTTTTTSAEAKSPKKEKAAKSAAKAQAPKATKAKATKTAKGTGSKKSAARAAIAKPTKALKPKGNSKGTGKYSASKEEPKHSKKKDGGVLKKALLISFGIIIVIFGCCCAAFAAVEESRSQYVPETTILDGQTDISGMTEEELRELLTHRVENEIATTITLNVGDTNYQVRFADIGSADIDATVEEAFAPYSENLVLRLFAAVGEVLLDETERRNISTACIVDPAALRSTVEKIASSKEIGPKDAGYAYDEASNALVVSQAKQGVALDVDGTIEVIEEALSSPSNGDPKRLMIQAVGSVAEPESYEPGQAIFVDTRGCFVHLYENGALVESFPCTPGTSGYATPTGDFYLAYKDGAPTWYNPHSAWSAGMAETIPPGPSNPLGVRALAVSCGNGIFIHGTTSVGGLGSPGSHGCVRLSNDNIVRLYDRVSEGIPIIIR